jgi:hypothetical protein
MKGNFRKRLCSLWGAQYGGTLPPCLWVTPGGYSWRRHMDGPQPIETKLKDFRAQLQQVASQGRAISNASAKKYLEKRIRELEYQLSLAAPPASVRIDTGHPSFDRLFPKQ